MSYSLITGHFQVNNPEMPAFVARIADEDDVGIGRSRETVGILKRTLLAERPCPTRGEHVIVFSHRAFGYRTGDATARAEVARTGRTAQR